MILLAICLKLVVESRRGQSTDDTMWSVSKESSGNADTGLGHPQPTLRSILGNCRLILLKSTI